MSDQSLRDALEKVLATTDGWTVSNETLLGLLAAHPAEPAPTHDCIGDDNIGCAACRAEGVEETSSIDQAQEAAAPLLGPRPLLGREAVREEIRSGINSAVANGAHPANWSPSEEVDRITDAVLELARPMPTREQIEAAVRKTIFAHFGTFTGAVKVITDDVVALLNGAES